MSPRAMAEGMVNLAGPWRRPLADVHGAARVLVLTGPLFSPYSLVAPFAILYMLAFLTPVQVGFLASLGFGVRFGALILGGFVADRWGRKQAITTFDTLGFIASFVVMAQASTFNDFLVGTVLAAMSTGSQAAWNCILVEEVPAAVRPRIVTLERLFVVPPSIVLPILASLLVDRANLVPVVRILYVVAAASITGMVLLRWLYMPVSGAAVVDSHRRLPATASVWVYAGAVRFLLWRRKTQLFLAAVLLSGFASGLGIFYSVFVTLDLGQPVGYLGYLAALGAAMGLLALLPLARRLGEGGYRVTVVAQALAATGVALLLASALAPDPVITLALLLASVVVGTSGFAGLLWTVGQTLAWATLLPNELRSKAMATQQALATLATIPSGLVAGYLFQGVAHWTPWGLMVALQGLGVALLVRMVKSVDLEGPTPAAIPAGVGNPPRTPGR